MINHLIGLVIVTQINSLLNQNLSLVENFLPSPVPYISSISQIILTSNKLCHEDLKLKCLDLLTMSNGRPVSGINSPMKITFRQSGGYAGLIRGCEINSELLTSKEAKELKSLVHESNFFEAQSKKTPNTADMLNYQIIIETIDKKHQVSFDKTSLPDEFIPLVKFLQERLENIN